MMGSNKAEPDLRGLTLVVVACAWLAGILCSSWLLLPPIILLPGAFAALVLVILLWRDSLNRLIMLVILFLLLGAWRFSIASPVGDPQAISAYIGTGKIEVQGAVSDEPKLGERSRSLLVSVSSISKNRGSTWQDAHGQLEVQILGSIIDDPYGPNYGDNVQLQGKLQPPSPYSPAGTFASMAFPRLSISSTGGNPIIAALYHLRIKLATIILQSLPQPYAALLVAIVLGLRTPALKTLSTDFNVTGTAHLIVPSGLKVTILAGLVAGSTRWFYKKREKQFFPLLPAQKRKDNRLRWFSTTLVILSIAAYTILSGAGPAALRAGIMGILLVIAPRIGRVYNVYTALAFAAFLMSLLDPFVLWDVGFLLSFLGTLGIVILTPLFQRLLSPCERIPFGHSLAEIIAVTLAAQTATLPIFALTFNQISFIAPLANMLTVPLLGAFIMLGILICVTGLFFAPLGIILGWIAYPLLWYVITIVTWCAQLPGAYLPVSNLDSRLAWCYYGLLVLIISPILRRFHQKSRTDITKYPDAGALPASLPFSQRSWRKIQLGAALLVILGTGATALAAQPDGQFTITFLDLTPIGQPAQGEAILLHTPDGKFAVIDGGLDSASLGQALDSHLPFWQRSLDTVLLTTSKQDHLVGLQDAITRYSVGVALDAGMLHPNSGYALWRRNINERNIQYEQVHQGITALLGTQVQLQVLWPPSQLHKGSSEELDNALIVRLVAPGLRVLLLGAAALSKFALTGLLTTIEPSYLQADIVQIVSESGKTFPAELRTILQLAKPSLLVVTPAALSAKSRKAGQTTTITLPPLLVSAEPSLQVVQTEQAGTIEISANENGWNMLSS